MSEPRETSAEKSERIQKCYEAWAKVFGFDLLLREGLGDIVGQVDWFKKKRAEAIAEFKANGGGNSPLLNVDETVEPSWEWKSGPL